MKVLWITNVPSPYRVDFFNLLGSKCQLDVVFECPFSKERDSSWKNFHMEGFNSFYLKGIQYKTDMAFSLEIIKFIKQDYDVIVVTDYASLTGIAAIEYMRLHHISFVLEGDGAYKGSGVGFKENLKRRLISSANYWMATSKEHQKFYLCYGAKREKIIQYPFTSIHKEDVLCVPPSAEEKKILRRQKQIREENVVLAVGQFIHRKGFDLLLSAASNLDRNIGFYLIGGNPTDEYLSIVKENGLTNVHFVDYMNADELKAYYQLADLFVLPTREDIWGLVVNEALSNGLPVVTTSACIAGCELIVDACGRIIEKDNIDQLLCAIRDLIYAGEWKRKAGAFCLNQIREYTLENMSDVHISVFDKILKGEYDDR